MASDNIPVVFKNLRGRMKTAMRTLPKVLGNEAVNWSKESFNRQGFLDETTQLWPGRKKNKGRNANKAILVQSGRLRRSIRIISSTETSVIIGTDVPYAKVHNYGFRGIVHVSPHKRQNIIRTSVKGSYDGIGNKRKRSKLEILGSRGNVKGYSYKQNIPKRQFMGNSANLRLRLFIVGRNHLLQKMK